MIHFTELSIWEKLMMKIGVKSNEHWLMIEYERLEQAHNACKRLLNNSDYSKYKKEMLEQCLTDIEQQMLEIKWEQRRFCK